LTSLLRDDRMKNRRDRAPFIGNPPGGSRDHQVHTECICTWLSIGFFLRTIFAIKMNGKNRPSREFRPFPQKRLALKRYGYVYKFLRLRLAQVPISALPLGGSTQFLTIFRKIHQKSTFAQGIVSAYFWPKNPISGGLGAQNSNFALFEGSFDGGRKTFRGLPSLKIWERSDKKWGKN